MNLHEYQTKSVFRSYGIPTPEGHVIEKPEDARKAFEDLGVPLVAVKAQIHAGGRGKAGGVKLAKSADEAVAIATELIGKTLVTHQTGPEGKEVLKVYVEAGSDIDRELYCGVVLDRKSGLPVMMVSTEGGMDIEEVAENTPDKILKVKIPIHTGLLPNQLRRICWFLGFPKEQHKAASKVLHALSKIYIEKDCSLIEINPLVVTKQGDVIALDGKMGVDDRGLARNPDIAEMRDLTEEDPTEVEAGDLDLNYISLDGNIGCMVNGAGLAMATMDVIKLHGGSPANFLDVGGGANKEMVVGAFKILLSNSEVKAILVNIFGGILKVDVLASGIVEAAKEVDLNIPLVVRLEGTNVEKGREILEESGLDLITATNISDAADKVVAAAGV